MTAQFEKDITPDGREYWYKNGKRHRLDGPAIAYPDSIEGWWGAGIYWPAQSREWWEGDSRVTDPTTF